MYLSLSASFPCARMVLIAPLERPGYIVQVQLAAATMSDWKIDILGGRFWPPYSSG